MTPPPPSSPLFPSPPPFRSLGRPPPPAVPAHATDRHAGDAGAEQRRLHLGQALGANDSRDQLHVHSFTLGVKTLSGRCQAASGSASNPPPSETSAGSLRMTADPTSGESG